MKRLDFPASRLTVDHHFWFDMQSLIVSQIRGVPGKEYSMPPGQPRQKQPQRGFDFTSAMWLLCEDVTSRLEPFLHIDMSRVAVSYAQTRSNSKYGIQAKLTPMRFEHGATSTQRNGREWTCQRLKVGGLEMLYILTFYLPRFHNQSFREKMITVLHELYHISDKFDGDIRRFGGRYHVHSASQKEYDRQMGRFSDEYLEMKPPVELYDWLKPDFQTLHEQHEGVWGLQIPIPKLIPITKTARIVAAPVDQALFSNK